jgi:hypothetical protein
LIAGYCFCAPASAKKLRVRAVKLVAKSVGKGISKLLLKLGLSATTGAKVLQPVVLPEMQGKACAQRSIFADLIFGSFHQGKEQSLPAAIERDDVGSLVQKQANTLHI